MTIDLGLKIEMMVSDHAKLRSKAGLLLLCIAILPSIATSQTRVSEDVCSDLESAGAADSPSALNEFAAQSHSGAYRRLVQQNARTQVLSRVDPLIRRLIADRFPELQKKQLRVRTFSNDSDYFRTRFSLSRFLLFRRMRYFVEVNPRLIERRAPAEGICGILGHELSHVSDMANHNRLRLFGLVRLLSPDYTRKFERRADLEAIEKGFASGLKGYRSWVYQSIPAESLENKKRNYFSPSEIDAIIEAMQDKPELLKYWKHQVPLNLEAIQAAAKRPAN